MKRTLTALAAMATLGALASPASAVEALRVKLVGKPVAEVYKDIMVAARAVCRDQVYVGTHSVGLEGECVKGAIDEAVAKIGSPTLTQYAKSPEALKLASAD